MRASFNSAEWQPTSSVDAKSVLRNALVTIGLTTREEVRTFLVCRY